MAKDDNLTWQRVMIVLLFTAGAITFTVLGKDGMAGYFAGAATALVIPQRNGSNGITKTGG